MPETHLAEPVAERARVQAGRIAAATAERRPVLWWAVLAVYLFLFVSLGYVAFLQPDRNPTLDPRVQAVVARVNDPATRDLLLSTMREEDEEHDARADLAKQSFHVVLGAMLGFLSATAARPKRREE